MGRWVGAVFFPCIICVIYKHIFAKRPFVNTFLCCFAKKHTFFFAKRVDFRSVWHIKSRMFLVCYWSENLNWKQNYEKTI